MDPDEEDDEYLYVDWDPDILEYLLSDEDYFIREND